MSFIGKNMSQRTNTILLRNRVLPSVVINPSIEPIRSNLMDIPRLLSFAAWQVRWNYTGGFNNANFFGSQRDWNQSLQNKMNDVSGQIHKYTLRGGANHVFINPNLLGLLNTMEYFIVDDMMIGGRYKVVLDDRIPENKIIMAYVMRGVGDMPLRDNGDGTVTFSLDYNYDNNRLNGIIQIDNLNIMDITTTSTYTIKCPDEIIIMSPRKLLLIRN
jgi:hypothetical protein